uniref:Uncharacterized protein n=1 Tax=Aegilops tauschii subsp. strangulata TaxID=200361 RepID=A0A453ENA0_AEGTS
RIPKKTLSRDPHPHPELLSATIPLPSPPHTPAGSGELRPRTMRPQAPPSLPSVQIHAYGPTPLPAARVSGADPLAAITTTGLGEPMFLPVAGGAEVSRSRSRRQRHTYQELELGHHRCLICKCWICSYKLGLLIPAAIEIQAGMVLDFLCRNIV